MADVVGSTPVAVLYGVLVLLPVLAAALLSLTQWNGLYTPKFIGFANWTRFFKDPAAGQALWVSIKVVVISWVVQTPLGLALGLFACGSQRYRAVYSTIYVVPLLVSTAGTSLMWQGLLDPNLGGIRWLASDLHAHWLMQNWLGNPKVTLYVIIAITTWQFIPFQMLIYQVGRRQIPEVLYSAASVDGASPIQQFRYVTLPQLRYTIVTSTILIVVGSLTYFDMVYILTLGGPGSTTNVLALEMYKLAFDQNEYGYASVFAVLLGLLGLAFTLGLMRASGFGRMQSQQHGIA